MVEISLGLLRLPWATMLSHVKENTDLDKGNFIIIIILYFNTSKLLVWALNKLLNNFAATLIIAFNVGFAMQKVVHRLLLCASLPHLSLSPSRGSQQPGLFASRNSPRSYAYSEQSWSFSAAPALHQTRTRKFIHKIYKPSTSYMPKIFVLYF